jgi:hypothetical protein
MMWVAATSRGGRGVVTKVIDAHAVVNSVTAPFRAVSGCRRREDGVVSFSVVRILGGGSGVGWGTRSALCTPQPRGMSTAPSSSSSLNAAVREAVQSQQVCRLSVVTLPNRAVNTLVVPLTYILSNIQGVELAATREQFDVAIQIHAATEPKHGHVKYITEVLSFMDKRGIKCVTCCVIN